MVAAHPAIVDRGRPRRAKVIDGLVSIHEDHRSSERMPLEPLTQGEVGISCRQGSAQYARGSTLICSRRLLRPREAVSQGRTHGLCASEEGPKPEADAHVRVDL